MCIRDRAGPPRTLICTKVLFLCNKKAVLGRLWMIFWWSQAGSNRRPPACKAGALPAELWPQKRYSHIVRGTDRTTCRANHSKGSGLLVGLGGFEPPTSPLSGVRSNQLSYRPRKTGHANLIPIIQGRGDTIGCGYSSRSCKCSPLLLDQKFN